MKLAITIEKPYETTDAKLPSMHLLTQVLLGAIAGNPQKRQLWVENQVVTYHPADVQSLVKALQDKDYFVGAEKPFVVLIHHDHPSLNTIEAIKATRAAGYDGPVYVFAGNAEPEFRDEAFKAGATGILRLKFSELERIVSAHLN